MSLKKCWLIPQQVSNSISIINNYILLHTNNFILLYLYFLLQILIKYILLQLLLYVCILLDLKAPLGLYNAILKHKW